MLLRQGLKLPMLAASWLGTGRTDLDRWQNGYIFLAYHRTTPEYGLELELEHSQFRQQLEYLAATGRVLRYSDVVHCLQKGEQQQGPHFILTFDDGFSDFYTHALPVLRALNLPAILFVTTGFVEGNDVSPLLAAPNLSVEAVTWPMLEEIHASGLVELGAHTHTHPVLHTISADAAEQELAHPIEVVQQRLGLRMQHFAYPRGIACECITKLVRKYYMSAVVGGGKPAVAGDTDLMQIPRVPIRRSDGWLFFQAKIHGWMSQEETYYAWLRSMLAAFRRIAGTKR